jgi:hypothetical protein
MASGQSTAYASLMGAISPEAKSTVRSHGPSRARKLRRVFCFPGQTSFVIRPAQAGTGDPDPGARAGMRAPEARGLPEGTRRRPDTDGRANQGSLWRRAVESAATEFVFRFGSPHVAAQTYAGGEDFGYTAPKAAIDVPWNPSGGMGETRVSVRLWPNLRFDCRNSDFACSPACFFDLPRCRKVPRQGGGEDVCYFG